MSGSQFEMDDLFDGAFANGAEVEKLAEGAMLFRCFAAAEAVAIFQTVQQIAAISPFRHMVTPGGHRMSVAMTNCGRVGWTTDRRGYRYDPLDPDNGAPWPAMPPALRQLAERAAALAGFPGFDPDSCLINRYEPGAKLTLHQDQIKTRSVTTLPSSHSRSAYPRGFSSVASRVMIAFAASAWKVAMSSCGAAHRASPITASTRSPTGITRSPGAVG
jgi:DNA alkylation damage repair protein AlkB